MNIVDHLGARLIGGSLVFVLLVSSSGAALPAQPETSPEQKREEQPAEGQSSSQEPARADSERLPDSPGAERSQAVDSVGGQSDAQQSPAQQPQSGKQKPVGTAAAEISNTTGFAAAKPAGAALAPAKQRRMRTILISVGAVVGGAIALGTIMALSKATPSKPPGSQ